MDFASRSLTQRLAHVAWTVTPLVAIGVRRPAMTDEKQKSLLGVAPPTATAPAASIEPIAGASR